MQAWIPNSQYGNHAFGLASMQEFIDKRDALMPWIEPFSPNALATAGDPPVLLFTTIRRTSANPTKIRHTQRTLAQALPRSSKPSASSMRSMTTTTTPT